MNKIYLIGDSTCHHNTKETYPQTGWGQVFCNYVVNNYEVINLAQNGRSSKSFYDEGLFKEVEENIQKGDLLFIQFGHNDEKEDELRNRFIPAFINKVENGKEDFGKKDRYDTDLLS